ncbi:MAG: hypothetical protein ACLPKB_01345 [Xanthobacteraceae bacterium]
MSDRDLRDQISHLEGHIEELAEARERCRKIILMAKVAIAAGGIWTSAILLGAIPFDPVAVIAAISIVLGGTVIFGSNTTTLKQISATIENEEALRAEFISKLELQVVGDGATEKD